MIHPSNKLERKLIDEKKKTKKAALHIRRRLKEQLKDTETKDELRSALDLVQYI